MLGPNAPSHAVMISLLPPQPVLSPATTSRLLGTLRSGCKRHFGQSSEHISRSNVSVIKSSADLILLDVTPHCQRILHSRSPAPNARRPLAQVVAPSVYARI